MKKLKLPLTRKPKKLSVQFDFSSVGKNLLTTEKVLEDRVKEYERLKEECRQPQQMLDLALKTLALAQLVAEDMGADIITDAHCRVSESYLLGGMHTQAMQHAFEGITRAKHSKRDPPPKVLMCLGRAYMASGNIRRAHELFGEALLAVREHHGPEAIDQCEVLCEMAEAYWREEKQNKSIDTLIDVWTLQEAKFGSNAPELIPTYLHLGQAYCKRNEYDRASDHLLRAVRISRESGHEEEGLTKTKSYAQACVLLASCYSYDQQSDRNFNGENNDDEDNMITGKPDYNRAIEYLQSGLDTYKDLYGPQCKESMKIMKEMAQIYLTMNRYSKAAECMEGVLQSVVKRHGAQSIEAGVTMKRIGEMYMIDNRIQEAKAMLKRALSVYNAMGNHDQRNQATIASLKDTLGRIKIALKSTLAMRKKHQPGGGAQWSPTNQAVGLRNNNRTINGLLSNERREGGEAKEEDGKIHWRKQPQSIIAASSSSSSSKYYDDDVNNREDDIGVTDDDIQKKKKKKKKKKKEYHDDDVMIGKDKDEEAVRSNQKDDKEEDTANVKANDNDILVDSTVDAAAGGGDGSAASKQPQLLENEWPRHPITKIDEDDDNKKQHLLEEEEQVGGGGGGGGTSAHETKARTSGNGIQIPSPLSDNRSDNVQIPAAAADTAADDDDDNKNNSDSDLSFTVNKEEGICYHNKR